MFVTQLAHWLHVGPVQHICWHCAGGVLPIAQRWKQPMLAEHWKSFRQFSVSLQHPATMHWLHGVPPGSSGQPLSITGLPQWPPEQTSPTQHCGEL